MIVTVTEPAISYKLVVRGSVIPCRDLPELAGRLAQAHRNDTAARARACTSLTRDRDLTSDEQGRLVALATEQLNGGGPATEDRPAHPTTPNGG